MSKEKDKPNSNIKEIEFKFNLFLFPKEKEQYIRIYDVLNKTHNQTFKTMFERLITNYDEVRLEFKEEAREKIIGNNYHEYSDEGDYQEAMQVYVLDRLDEQFLMHYQFELMSLSNLYQVFEQQLRKWLYEEFTHYLNQRTNQVKFSSINKKGEDLFSDFIGDFGKITKGLKELKLTFANSHGIEEFIVDTDIWQHIRECNLLSNTYKHGSGYSAFNLYEICPEYFEKIDTTRFMDLYRTTNLERVLDVKKISFEKYINAMKQFWVNMKERQSGTIKMKVNIPLEKQ